MKILLANSLYHPNIVGGAERVVQSLAEALTGRGHEVVVVTTQPHGDAAVNNVNGVRVRYVPTTNIYRVFSGAQPNDATKALWHVVDTYNPAMGRLLGRILDEVKPDVVNTHNLAGFSVAALAAVKGRGLPLAHALHDQYLLCPRATMFKGTSNCTSPCIECRLYALPRRLVSRHVDVAIGVSRFILQRHLQYGYFPNGGRRVIYNSFVPKQATARPKPRGPRPFRFGFLGQIRDTKGLHLLIDAFAEECASESQLWIAGRGDPLYEAQLRQRTAGLQSVRWLGFVKPEELLDEIDVLVVPSIWDDTAPLVVLEANGSGVPVLGSSRGGIPELVAPGAGWIFDPGSSGALRAALRLCIQSAADLDVMGDTARRHAQTFGLERFVDGYLDAYDDALRRSVRRS